VDDTLDEHELAELTRLSRLRPRFSDFCELVEDALDDCETFSSLEFCFGSPLLLFGSFFVVDELEA
jgi:hypothetical protein